LPFAVRTGFLLWCLGNNVLERLPKGADEDENARAAVIAKKGYEQQTSFSN
jgi:hypothetical protein